MSVTPATGWSGERRPVPEDWERRLYTHLPPSMERTWLKVRWERGDPWSPINRWVIWQMFPPATLCDPNTRLLKPYYRDVIQELQGPHPRSTGHYCAPGWCPCDLKANRWRDGTALLIDAAQWELWQETQCVGSRYWIVEGPNGGRRYRLNTIERALYRFAEQNVHAEWPAPGSLPYADLNDMVWQQLRRFEQVRAWQATMAYLGQKPEKDGEELAAEQELRRLVGDWFKEQVYAVKSSLTRAEKQEFYDQRPVGLGKEVTGDAQCAYDERYSDFLDRG